MSTLTITKNYDDSTILTEAQLDAMKSSAETYFNTTKITSDNIQTAGLNGNTVLQNSSIATAKINDGSISGSSIEDEAVTTAKITTGIAVGKWSGSNRIQTIEFNGNGVSNSSSSTTASATILSGSISLTPEVYGTSPRSLFVLLGPGYFDLRGYTSSTFQYPLYITLTFTLTSTTEGAQVSKGTYGFQASDTGSVLVSPQMYIPYSAFSATYHTVTPQSSSLTLSISAEVSRTTNVTVQQYGSLTREAKILIM